MRDVVIIGGGASGLTAGIYLSRFRIDTILLESNLCGGVASSTHIIENYPGFPDGIDGAKLLENFKLQALKFGLEIKEFTKVLDVDFSSKVKKVFTKDEVFESYGVIIATGSVPKKLGVPGEDRFFGRGVSFCATCDAPLFRGKRVCVIGGGDSALKESLLLEKFAEKVFIVNIHSSLRGERINLDKVLASKKIEVLNGFETKEIIGDGIVRGVRIKSISSSEEVTLDVDGVFVYIGFLPNTSFLKGKVDLDENGYVIVDGDKKTSVDGVFAIGDVRSGSKRQVAISVGDGAEAAIGMKKYIEGII